MVYNKNKIAILLSTYNGEKYLGELLESLLSQTFSNFTVYIRDDGSTDSTLKIIAEYVNKDRRIYFLDDKQHFGPTKTFLYLLKEIDSDYYMFCDQDDVWLEDKVAVTYQKMQEQEAKGSSKPILIYTDLVVVDGELNQLAPSYFDYAHRNFDLPTSFDYVCVYNNISACTMMINKEAQKAVDISLPDVPKKFYHDWLIAVFVSRAGGDIVPVKKSTILFRRHGDNETCVKQSDTRLLTKIPRLYDTINKIISNYRFFKMLGYPSLIRYIYCKVIISIKNK
jgi:rhamnosyltransferase